MLLSGDIGDTISKCVKVGLLFSGIAFSSTEHWRVKVAPRDEDTSSENSTKVPSSGPRYGHTSPTQNYD